MRKFPVFDPARLLAGFQIRAGVSLLALAVGMAVAGVRQAQAASCGNAADAVITVDCTGPLTWGGGNITNSAAISGGTIGVAHSGNVGTLTNSGSISGGNDGFQNDVGTVDSLVNTGSITGQGRHGVVSGEAGTANFGVISNKAFATISGAQSGLYFAEYSAGADLIENAGEITGTTTGITVTFGPTITSINNSGTISGAIGINNSGTITALTNSGTIQGGTAAIQNAGEIGSITNSGVIDGNIINNSTNALTINGATAAGIYGRLTGGTITSTGANLIFGTGNLQLENNVNVTGHSLLNNGATLRLIHTALPTVTGTYSQSGGGLVSVVGSASNYGYLNVTGDASVANATVTLSGSTMQAGETYTVVQAGGTGSYSGNTVAISGRGGLTASLGAVGNNLVVTLAAKDYGTIGGSGATGAMTGPLSQIAGRSDAAANSFQAEILARLDALPQAQQAAAVRQLAPTQNAPAAQMGQAAAGAVLGAVEQHQQTAMAYEAEGGRAAGSDAHDASIWGQVLGGGALRDSSAAAAGYRSWNYGLAFGMDNRFTPNLMAGVAFSWIRGVSQGIDDAAGSSTILDNFQITQYGTLRYDRAFMDWQAALGWNRFDQKRAIAFLGRAAQADYDGQQFLARAKVGYDFSASGATLTPLAGLAWSHVGTDAYTEREAGTAGLSVDRQTVDVVSHSLGAKLATKIPTAWGLAKAELRTEWIHDYTDDAIATSGLIGGAAFTSTTPRLAADGLRLGLALTLNSDNRWSLRAETESEFRSGYQSHTGLVKAILGF